MKRYFSAALLRIVFPGLLGTTALATTACHKDTTAAAPYDYASEDEATIQKYLTDNHITNAQKQPSGLYYIPVITNPNGLRATAGRTVSVLYTGTLLNGTVFDASSQHGNTPIAFVLGSGQVIKGWDEGIALMKLNEKSILLIPSRYAYGASSPSASIPANSILRFEVELKQVQ
ncbi:MAG: FKBP-type peptidyl-prolyl cis-trans isomerase [Bacteroidota bacterium]|nr:FKBP-type peptidyl-prolyl cis-trans isomerase [Bacteroidota bacterium]